VPQHPPQEPAMTPERPLETRINVFDLDLQRRLRQDDRIHRRATKASGRTFSPLLLSFDGSPRTAKYKKPRLLHRPQREQYLMMMSTRMFSEVQRTPMSTKTKMLDRVPESLPRTLDFDNLLNEKKN
jgi:hypothetical protein